MERRFRREVKSVKSRRATEHRIHAAVYVRIPTSRERRIASTLSVFGSRCPIRSGLCAHALRWLIPVVSNQVREVLMRQFSPMFRREPSHGDAVERRGVSRFLMST